MTKPDELRQEFSEESTSTLLNRYDLLQDKIDLIEEELQFRKATGQRIVADDQITMIETRLFARA